jgi:hypothetical protein
MIKETKTLIPLFYMQVYGIFPLMINESNKVHKVIKLNLLRKLILTSKFPGRADRYLPAPPQTRTSRFPASGSSD